MIFPQDIPIIGITGDIGTGKTLFMLRACLPMILPDNKNVGVEPKDILVIDKEKSSSTYQTVLKFDRIDIYDKILQTNSEVKEYQLYKTLESIISELAYKQYKIIQVDPINEFEEGIKDYVMRYPEQYGYTANQFNKMPALIWGCVKAALNNLIMLIAQKCECFVFVTHLGDIFLPDGRPTGKKKPRGKTTLMKNATLYFYLKRNTQVSFIPDAKILKSRLNVLSKDGKLIDLFPENLIIKEFDYEKLFDYMENPEKYVDNYNIEAEPEPPLLNDDERLLLNIEKLKLEKEQREQSQSQTSNESRTSKKIVNTTDSKATNKSALNSSKLSKKETASNKTDTDKAEINYIISTINGYSWFTKYGETNRDTLINFLKIIPVIENFDGHSSAEKFKRILPSIDKLYIDTLIKIFYTFENFIMEYDDKLN